MTPTVTEQAVLALNDEVHRDRWLFQFLDALPVGVCIGLPGGRPFYANREAVRVLGRGIVPSIDEEHMAEIYQVYRSGTDELYPRERMGMMQAFAGMSSHNEDSEIRQPNGTVVPIETWGTPVMGPEGDVRYAIAAFVDITERRRVECQLASQAAMLEIARDPVFLCDTGSRITYWNAGAEETYGYTREEAVGRVSYELLMTQFPEPLESIVAKVAVDGKWEGELVQQRRDGEMIVVESRWAASRALDGRLLGVMEVQRDISERKRAAVELARWANEVARANVQLARSNEELEQFAYVASHDLAEPLRAISGPISLLARRYEGKLDAESDQFIEFAVDGCRRMQAMIDDLLAYSRAGRTDGQLERVDCNRLMGTVMAGLAARVAETGAVVTVDPLPTVDAQPLQLVQLFQNLVTNALKFVVAGVVPEVAVSAERLDHKWRITVTDNGIGIEPRHRERIFGMFKRLHSRTEYAGTGIGLALCKRVVERIGGRIGVEAAPVGTGTRFWFTLPISQEERL